jgi:RNA polymerase sigma-54 factor
MSLAPKLQFRQALTLVVTPQLLQAIRMLQMGHAELERLVESELEANPLLMRGEEADEDGGPASPTHVAPERGLPLRNVAGREGQADGFAPSKAVHRDRGRGSGETSDPAARVAAEESLAARLEAAIDASFADLKDRFVARILLMHLDEAGYLTVGVDAVTAETGASEAAVARVLKRCQDFEPTGVFARSLAECLALQLAEQNRLDPAMRALLDNLDLLAARDFAGLRRRCGIDEDDLLDMISEIKACDPKPGLRFAETEVRPVVPDVLVRPAPDGGWMVELNEEVLPRVLVDHSYAATISASGDVAGRSFLAGCLKQANWLAKSLDQRARTILKVAAEIVRRQDSFLTRGVDELKPLNLKSVAEAIGVHESTVSRAASGKHLATPRGVFEMKFFFSGALPAADGGEAHSAEAVKHRIRMLVDGEPHAGVLSDDALAALLRRDGIEIARRTVTKYREAMRIPSSVQRRREKRVRIAS